MLGILDLDPAGGDPYPAHVGHFGERHGLRQRDERDGGAASGATGSSGGSGSAGSSTGATATGGATGGATHSPTPNSAASPTPNLTGAPGAGGGGTAGLQDIMLFGLGGAAILAGAGSIAYRRRLTRGR